jgi:hypothetical protein
VKSLNKQRRLALFVGAGISMGCGLPGWKELVDRVVHDVWRSAPGFADHLRNGANLLAARYAKQKRGVKFNQVVHKALYTGDVQISRCVRAIAKSGVRQICNFNFDDLLIEAILTDGTDCVVATPDEAFESRVDKVTIFHPHGILPLTYRGEELDSARIVFSEDDYHALYSDPYSWANIAQLSLLTSYSVLFIGLSMQDPNLRRLIDTVRERGFKNQHFAVFRDPAIGKRGDARVQANGQRKLIELDMRSLGVTPWFVDSHDKVAEIIENIRVNRIGQEEVESAT